MDFSLFVEGIASQDVCHMLVVCMSILLFMSWYGSVVMYEDRGEEIASFANLSAFSFLGIPV